MNIVTFKRVITGTLCVGLMLMVSQRVYAQEGAQRAQAVQCGAVDQSAIDDVFNQALTTITNLSNRAVRLRDRGVWRPDRNFADTFLRRGARSLSRIKALLGQLDVSNASCNIDEVSACEVQSVPKKKLLKAFDAIFSVSFPRGLESLKNRQKAQRKRFKRKIATLQASYAVCS